MFQHNILTPYPDALFNQIILVSPQLMFQSLSLGLYVSIGFLDPGGIKRSVRVARSDLRQRADRPLVSRNVFAGSGFGYGCLEGVGREYWGACADEVKTVVAGAPWPGVRIKDLPRDKKCHSPV